MANKALTERDLELIKILITEPQVITQNQKLAGELANIYTKPIKVADLAYLVGATQTIETNRLLRYIGVYQNIFMDKLGLSKNDFQKYFKEYDDNYNKRMEDMQAKMDKQEAQASEIKKARQSGKDDAKPKVGLKKDSKKDKTESDKVVPLKSKNSKGTK